MDPMAGTYTMTSGKKYRHITHSASNSIYDDIYYLNVTAP